MGGKESSVKAEFFLLSLEKFFDEGRDSCRDFKNVLEVLSVSELSRVCKEVELGAIPYILI